MSLESKATAEAERPSLPRRQSTFSPGPPLPPKPDFFSPSPLKRRPTIPAEAQPNRQAPVVKNNVITLPCLDIIQNGNIYRESELLVDILNVVRDQWPERPYAVINHLRNSLLVAVAACDDPSPVFASDHGGGTPIKRAVCRFRRYRKDRPMIDLCLVLWDDSFMSYRERRLLQETHRYKPQQAGDANFWPGAQKILWYPSWEPSKNLDMGTVEEFVKDREICIRSGGDNLTFEVRVADSDWC